MEGKMELSPEERILLEEKVRDAGADFICDLEDQHLSEGFCPYGYEREITVKIKFQNEGIIWTRAEIIDSEK